MLRLLSFSYRVMPVLIGAVALIIHLLTMAPGLAWGHDYAGRDGGDFITAAWHLGVPHPTGYPTYTVIAWLFTRLPLGSVAWRVQLFSGAAGVGVVVFVYLIGRRLSAGRMMGAAALGAGIGALLLGFARLFWVHTLVAEVYALHLFFVALIVWLMLRWRDGNGPLWLAALAFGLGMGNHITLVFLGPTVLLLLWYGRHQLSWRSVLLSALALGLGLLVYLYLPWRAANDPIVNWADPDKWEGFWWMVSGKGYRRFFFALPGDRLLSRLEEWGQISNEQFPLAPLAWFLAALGFVELARRDRWLALATFIHAAINLIYSIGYNTTDASVYLLPVLLYLALWMGQGAASLFAGTRQLCEPGVRVILDTFGPKRSQRKKRRKAGRRAVRNGAVASVLLVGVVVGLLLLPLLSLAQDWSAMDLTNDRRAKEYATAVLEKVEPGALILVGSDVYTFALWYYRYVEEVRPDVPVVNYAMLSFEWYQHTVAVHHPEVVLPGGADAAHSKRDHIRRNLERWPVYITEDEDDLANLKLEPIEGIPCPGRGHDYCLWRVTSP